MPKWLWPSLGAPEYMRKNGKSMAGPTAHRLPLRDRSHQLRSVLIGVGLIIAAGCTKLGPDFVQPDAPVADAWLQSSTPGVKADVAQQTEWWRAFGDPVLDVLIVRAYEQNLPLQIAGIRILEARAQLGVAVGSQYPQFQQARGGIGHVELSEHQPNASPQIDSNYRDVDIGFDAAWELDIWGRFRRGVEAADANLLAEVANYDDVLVSLTAEVANAYIVIRTFEARLVLARENVALQQRSLEIADVRFKNGITTELDVQQARTLLHNTQALIPALQIGLRQAKHGLSILLGIPPSDLQPVLSGAAMIPTASAEVAIGIPADLLRRRPDIRRAELQAAAQSAVIGVAVADLYPQFTLTGSLGLRSSDTGRSSVGDLFDGGSFEFGIGPSVQWNIFNYGRLKNSVRVEDARFQQAIVNYQNTVLQAAREVEDGLVAFLRGKEQIVFLTRSVEAARRSVDLALIQYRDGAADYTRVLDTQEFLVAQHDRLTETHGDVARSLVATYKALGGGWEIRSGKDFVNDDIKRQMDGRTDWGAVLDSGAKEPVKNTDGEGLRKPDW